HFQLAVEDFFLELVAKHDVHRIRHFVSIDANQTATHTREQSIQILDLPLWPGYAADLLEQRLQVFEERAIAANDHLEQQRLALLDRHAAIASNRLTAPRLRQANVVHRV